MLQTHWTVICLRTFGTCNEGIAPTGSSFASLSGQFDIQKNTSIWQACPNIVSWTGKPTFAFGFVFSNLRGLLTYLCPPASCNRVRPKRLPVFSRVKRLNRQPKALLVRCISVHSKLSDTETTDLPPNWVLTHCGTQERQLSQVTNSNRLYLIKSETRRSRTQQKPRRRQRGKCRGRGCCTWSAVTSMNFLLDVSRLQLSGDCGVVQW